MEKRNVMPLRLPKNPIWSYLVGAISMIAGTILLATSQGEIIVIIIGAFCNVVGVLCINYAARLGAHEDKREYLKQYSDLKTSINELKAQSKIGEIDKDRLSDIEEKFRIWASKFVENIEEKKLNMKSKELAEKQEAYNLLKRNHDIYRHISKILKGLSKSYAEKSGGNVSFQEVSGYFPDKDADIFSFRKVSQVTWENRFRWNIIVNADKDFTIIVIRVDMNDEILTGDGPGLYFSEVTILKELTYIFHSKTPFFKMNSYSTKDLNMFLLKIEEILIEAFEYQVIKILEPQNSQDNSQKNSANSEVSIESK